MLQGKRIIVTGGVTGMGRATVLAALREGASVVSMSRASPTDAKATSLIEAASEIASARIRHIQLDVREADRISQAFGEAMDFLGGLDGLLNSAGVHHEKASELTTAQDFIDQYSTNFIGATALTSVAALDHLKQHGGSIVNSSSIAGIVGMPMMAAYGAAKAAIAAYTQITAKEWGPYGVRVNAICPSIRSDMYNARAATQTTTQQETEEAGLLAAIPLKGGLRGPSEAAKAILFLLSDNSSYITGQILPVDGGLMMVR